MTYLPRFTHLEVSEYDMFPGRDGEGFARRVKPGFTLAVGANGLGKTTLLLILRMLCVGKAKLKKDGGTGLGAGQLGISEAIDRKLFAQRVADRARGATASLTMRVGDTNVSVTRALANLDLARLEVGGDALDVSEDGFRDVIVAASGVPSFADWILLIDALTFVGEERIQPLWDKDAQRHLLRVLVNPSDTAQRISEGEGRHISIDSEFRNVRSQLGSLRDRRKALLKKLEGESDVRGRLAKVEQRLSEIDQEVARREDELEGVEEVREEALRNRENAESNYQDARERLEAARLLIVEAAMPSQDDVAKYLAARLVAEGACPLCRQAMSRAASTADSHICPVCGQAGFRPADASPDGQVDEADLGRLEEEVSRAAESIDAIADEYDETLNRYDELIGELSRLRSERSELDERRATLLSRLPGDGEELEDKTAAMAELEGYLTQLRTKLEQSRERLDGLISEANAAVRNKQAAIKSVFDEIASAFLLESCELVPHSTKVRIGQEGQKFGVQTFDLNMESATGAGETLRSSPDAVSESQRIYLDIAFRIALIKTCASGGSGSLVIDAPEGSLDAVFTKRAARLLNELGDSQKSPESRVVIATNLIDGLLLPALTRAAGIGDRSDPRLIDLLSVAAPTAAVTRARSEYDDVLDRALDGVAGRAGTS